MRLAQHDTYRALENFARHPHSRTALYQYELAMKRTECDVRGEAIKLGHLDMLDLTVDLLLGVTVRDAPQQSADDAALHRMFTKDGFEQMSQEEKDRLYIKQCAQAGITIDPQALIDARQQQTRETDK